MRRVDAVTASIGALLARYALIATHTRLIAKADCEIWRITLAPGGSEPTPEAVDVALRIYPARYAHRDAIGSELAWLQALAEQGLNTPAPLTDRHGLVVQEWPHDEPGAPRLAVLLRWVAGRHFDKALRPVHMHRVGVLCAQMHTASQALAAAGRITSKRTAPLPDLAGWSSGARPASAHLTRADHERTARTAQALLGAIEALPQGPASHGFIHGDLHLWNLLFAGSRAGAIDFTDCGWGAYALDLAAALQYVAHPLHGFHDHRPRQARMRAALLDGYASQRALPPRIDEQLDTYIVARMLFATEWVLDDWAHPTERAWGPQFLRDAQQLFERYLQR